MTANEFDISGFKLVEDTSSPTTGIKINLNLTQSFEAQSTFRFTDQTASKDASLSNIVISSGETDEENPSKSTYKEHSLAPTFNKETFNYEIELLEYIDTMKIKATTSDENATMKLKVPKRDENNNLKYDTNGTTIIYEEKEIQSDTPLEFTLNKLGEPDTHLTINITAEDERTTSTYEIVIKRPYGIIKGSVKLGNGIRESIESSYGVRTQFNANINLFKVDSFNWEGILTGESTYEELDEIVPELQVQADGETGEYEIKVIPGEYDLQLNKKGFLDQIVKNITINAGQEIDLGLRTLIAGDVDRDGIIGLQDVVAIVGRIDKERGNNQYGEQYDFGQKGVIALIDVTTLLEGMDQLISVEKY